MASEALTICVFMVCAALTGAISGDGYLRPTNEGPLACDAVRDVYNEMIGTSDETNDPVYQQPKYVGVPTVCRLSKTCCSRVAEQNLSASVVTEVGGLIGDLWEQKTSSCSSKTFKDALAEFIEENKVSLVALLEQVYSIYFTQRDLFDEFYAYLQQAVRTGNTCQIGLEFNKLFFKVFLTVLDGNPAVNDEVYPKDDHDFNACMYNYYESVMEDQIHVRFIALTRSFNRTLYYLRALDTAEEFLRTVLELEMTPQCRQALLRSSYCAQCSGLPYSVRPCQSLCLNTLRGCLVDYSDLYEPYRKFADATVDMKKYLDEIVNPFTHIDQLTTGFLNLIQDILDQSITYHRQILIRCYNNGNKRRRREAVAEPAASEDHLLYPRSLFPRSTVAPPSEAFNKSAYCHLDLVPLWRTIPESVCQAMSSHHNNLSCWNGDSVNRYERELLNFTREEQLDNPEMIVCPVLPRKVRVQLARLERVTQEMNIISRSEACPEDDEDCQVDLHMCNFKTYRSAAIDPSVPRMMTDDDDEDSKITSSGSGCGLEDRGSGFGSGSGECGSAVIEEVEACLADPLISPVPSATIQQPSSTSSSSSPSTEPPSVPSTSSLPSPSPSSPPSKEPPIVIAPASCLSLVPSTLVLLLSLFSLTVLQSVL